MLSRLYRLPGYRIPVIIKTGKRVHSEFASVIFLPTEESLQFAVIIPKKVAKLAVSRNRVKRLMTEALHKNMPAIKPGHEIIFLIKKVLKEWKLEDVQPLVLDLLQKANLLK